MADFITPILNIVSFLCSCSANNRCCYLLDLQENKDALNTAMEELKATRDDVKRRVDESENNPNEIMKRTHEVNSWLERVQTIEGEVGKILEKVDKEIQGRCFGGYCPRNCWSAHKIGKLVIRKLPIVNDLRSKGSFGDVAYKLPPPLVQIEPMDSTVAMKTMFDKVLKSLVEDDVRIMGLYGQGGVGKTTLLKQINNEFLKSTSSTLGFDVVILVVVSKAVNTVAIQKEIGDRLGLSSPNKTNICNALSKRNFLLLLDDIWERVDLQSIGIPHPENNKSKVLFTTRSENVCGAMDANKKFRVECLPWDEAWTLFQEKVGNDALNSHPKVPELAKVVAKECGCLPLALVTIGRAMSTKKTVQEWNHAITTLRRAASDFPGMGDEVLPLLKLSYDNLRDDTIKSCFLYCALFPEDRSIMKAQIIDYWIGEGLILLNEFDHIDEARNYGYDVIGNLKGACLLESGYKEETELKMHDTIRDLALWITSEFGSSKKDKMLIIESFYGTRTSESLFETTKRIYLSQHNTFSPSPVMQNLFQVTEPTPGPPLKFPNLLTLVCERRISPYSPSPVTQNLFEFMPFLRVLDLSGSNMRIFPTSITELLELQYLSLHKTHIQVLPEELRKLVKLNYLDLSDMKYLKKIPSGVIGCLLELRVLKLSGCFQGEWDNIIEEMYNLKHLNDLRISIKTQHNLSKLLSNKNLQMCTKHLDLSSASVPSSSSSSSSRIKSLGNLELLSNLETLYLDSLPEAAELMMNMNMGVWRDESHHYCCFQNLSKIQFLHCNALKDLTWVGYVGNLKTLDVLYCEEIEVIVVDDFGGATGGGGGRDEMIFKSLKTLGLRDLPKLKSICRNALAFPCLEYLVVEKCPQLKKLPFDSGSNVNNTLRQIAGGSKWWSELQWEEQEDHNKELLKSKFLPYFLDLYKYN